MNNLIVTHGVTSTQIAELTGKRHADIMRDIRDEVEKLEAGGINSERKFALSSCTTEQPNNSEFIAEAVEIIRLERISYGE